MEQIIMEQINWMSLRIVYNNINNNDSENITILINASEN